MDDYSDVPVIDTHVHTPMRWDAEDSILGLGENDYIRVAKQILPKDTSQKLYNKVLDEVRFHSRSRPAATSMLHYYAKLYKLNTANRVVIDKHLREEIRKHGPTSYAERTFKREKIKWLLVDQSFYPTVTEQMADAYPRRMSRWTFPLADLVQPTFALKKGLSTLEDSVDYLKKQMKLAAANGCSGFKSIQGYFREFLMEKTSARQVEKAFKLLKKSKPLSYVESPARVPIYSGKMEMKALKTYQDYLLRSAFSTAGELGLPVTIHVAVGEVPQLKPWNNDPSGLYSIFDDEEIQKNNTQFVILHTGFPAHHVITSIITQYPNVSVDLSWISHASILTESILEEYLMIAPPTKIMHGSDGSHPDVIAFAAHSTKTSLSRISKRLRENHGWSRNETFEVAELVLYRNAERIFGNGRSN